MPLNPARGAEHSADHRRVLELESTASEYFSEQRASFQTLDLVHYVDRVLVTVTFWASVLNRTPFACTTVIVIAPVLLVLMSRTIPSFPECDPAVTTQTSPSLTTAASIRFIRTCQLTHAQLDGKERRYSGGGTRTAATGRYPLGAA